MSRSRLWPGPINLSKNHLENDTIKAYPMDGLEEEQPPHRFLPLSKVK